MYINGEKGMENNNGFSNGMLVAVDSSSAVEGTKFLQQQASGGGMDPHHTFCVPLERESTPDL